MKTTNAVYTSCPECRMEPHGMDEVIKIFGFYSEKNELKPYRYCRSCRMWMERVKSGKFCTTNTKNNRHLQNN